jgi:hypothetical protein
MLNEFGMSETGTHLRTEIGDKKSILIFSDTLANLIDDGLIIGVHRSVKLHDEQIFSIQRLSTDGYQYLSALEQPKAKEKLIKFAKENGLAPTINNMSKLVANLLFN